MTIKTVADLQEYLEDFLPDTEIRIAYQPNWPLAGTVNKVSEVDDKVWIAVGEVSRDENPYAPKEIWEL